MRRFARATVMSALYPRARRAHATAESSEDLRPPLLGPARLPDLEAARAPNPRLVPSPSGPAMPVPRGAQLRCLLALLFLSVAVAHFARLLDAHLLNGRSRHLTAARAWRLKRFILRLFIAA